MTIGAAQQFFLGASKATGGGGAGYQIERSLRFNSSDSAYLSRTPAVAGNRRTWTWAGWVKRSAIISTRYTLFAAGISSSAETEFFFEQSISADTLRFYHYAGSYQGVCTTTAVFRDTSAWYHIVLAVDTTQATASNQCKIYVNGVQQNTTFTTDFTQNADLYINSTVSHGIGYSPTNGLHFSGYLADVYFIDGQALTPSSFTEVSATTGQLIPKAYTGSFGTNGFHLPFSDNSTAAALGTDTSGNGNSWTVNNIAPSNGATYSNRGSLSSSPPTLSGTISDIFDGLLNSSNAFSVNQANAGVTINFSPALPSGSSVKLVGGVYGTAGSNNSLQVNGTGYAQSLPASTGTYTEIVEVSVPAGASGITSIYIYREGISTFNFALYGIKVNDVLLVDGAAGDSLVDTPTSYGTDTGAGGEVRGNYATWNPLDNGGVTLANGNLDISNGSSHKAVRGTIKFPATGKWYAEFLLSTFTSGVNACAFGIDYSGATTPSAWGSSGHIYLGGNSTTLIGDINGAQTAISTTSIVGSIFQIAYDADAQKVWVGRDNTWYNSTWGTTGNPATGANPTASNISGGFPAVTTYETSGSANFGQRAFAYTAPSGFKALCDTNLPAPVVAKPSTVFDIVTRNGFGSAGGTVSSLSFAPDLIWDKPRSIVGDHYLFDAVRTVSKSLSSSTTSSESSYPNWITGTTSTGYTVGSSDWSAGTTVVEWCWNAGGSTVSNTQGSITSQVRANVSAGFSVVTWTSPSSGDYTIGHGLGVAPSLVITKSRSASGDQWYTFHRSVCTSTSNYLKLSSTDGLSTYAGAWGATLPTSTVVGLNAGGGFIPSSATAVAYCFAPVSGYSSFGSYTGNGSADGPFVYTGFESRWLLVKASSFTQGWALFDTAREPTNDTVMSFLQPNTSNAETGITTNIDILSNGFKPRANDGNINSSGQTYIYAAFAKSPFQYARAR